MQDFGVASSHNLALRPPSCVKQASWCPRHFQKRNSPGSSVSVDTTSCQKLRRNKQMTPISSFASFLFPSDRVQLNESKTKLPQRAILIVRVTLMPVHFCNYLPRIQRCTISCEGKALIRFSHLGRNIPFNTWLIGSGKRLLCFIMFICILSLIHQIIDLQIGLDILNGSYYLYHHKWLKLSTY